MSKSIHREQKQFVNREEERRERKEQKEQRKLRQQKFNKKRNWEEW